MSDKSILITGCSSGLGFDAALRLKDRGWHVLATARDAKDVARLAALGLDSYRLDLACPESTANGAEEALARTDGALYALYNNGAFALPGAVEDLSRDALQSIFNTNLFAQFDLIHRLLPAMKAQGRGHIINNSSVLGLCAVPYRGAYCSTKFAMEALTDALRMENRDSPIRITLIEPGPIPSRIRINSRVHFERWIDWTGSSQKQTYKDKVIPFLYNQDNAPSFAERPPSEATRILLKALESPNPAARYYVTPMTYIVNLMRRMLPTSALDAILARS